MKISTIAFYVFALIALASCGGGRGANASGAAADQAESTAVTGGQVIALSDSLIAYHRADTVKLGRIKSGETVSRSLTVKNAGDKPLVIIDVDRSCGCIVVEFPRRPLKPGEEAPMELQFDSRGLAGWLYKSVYIETSSEAGNYTLVVTADVE